MQRITGIADAMRISAVASDDRQSVTVTDGEDCVKLSLGTSSFPAGLTPEQARQIARDLRASADRVEAGCGQREGRER
jgi:hypothetical protein